MKDHTTDETTYPYATIGSLTARGGRVTLVPALASEIAGTRISCRVRPFFSSPM